MPLLDYAFFKNTLSIAPLFHTLSCSPHARGGLCIWSFICSIEIFFQIQVWKRQGGLIQSGRLPLRLLLVFITTQRQQPEKSAERFAF